MKTIDWEAIAEDRDFAREILAGRLRKGELALLLGAGVSQSVGFPNWRGLLKESLLRVPEVPSRDVEKLSTEELGDCFEELRTKLKTDAAFNELIRNVLYKNWQPGIGHWANDLLIAIGTLIIPGRRGHVDTVLTLNFDDVLEQYLRVYGFVAQSSSEFPVIRSGADVIVYHSHGFLPYGTGCIDHEKLILDSLSYDQDMGNSNSLKRRMMESVIYQKIIVGIGVSGADPYSRAVIAATPGVGTVARDVVGYWLMIGEKESNEVKKLVRRRIFPILFKDVKEIPPFILSVAETAAANFMNG